MSPELSEALTTQPTTETEEWLQQSEPLTEEWLQENQPPTDLIFDDG